MTAKNISTGTGRAGRGRCHAWPAWTTWTAWGRLRAGCSARQARRRRADGLPHASGFSLIELMVGMTIGLLTVLVVVNVLGVADARRRTTTSGADAVINAQLALYTVERDGKSAGYGMTTVKSALGCPIQLSYKGATRSALLAPAQITDGVGGAPDTVVFGVNQRGDIALPTRIVLDHPHADDGFFIQSDLAAKTGDLMLAVPADTAPAATWCTVFAITSVVPEANRIMHDVPGDWNVPVAASIMPSGGYKSGDYLLNLGRYAEQVYDIDGQSLRLRQRDLAGNQPVGSTAAGSLYSGIVQLQAVYGKDTDGDELADTWNATAPSGAAWQQVIAVRVALVARSQKREAGIVTLDGASSCGAALPPPTALCWRPDPAQKAEKIDVSATVGSDWQHYRYQVLDTTIPLRNAIWKQ